MEIYNSVIKVNQKYKNRLAVSMTMTNGTVEKYTYGALFEETDLYVKWLMACGIEPGDRVALIAENSPQWQMAFLAVMKVRGTAVLLDATLGKDDLKKLIKRSDVRAIYTSPKIKEKLGESAQYRVPVLNLAKEGTPFKDSYKARSPFIEKTKDPDPTVAMIIYSSGTTKSAAGIMHTHEAMIKTVRMTARANELDHHDRILSILPNSHIYGMVTGVLGSMLLGAALHYVENINSELILKAFKSFKPTVFPCVPKVFELFEKQIVSKIESDQKTKGLFEYFYPICERTREQSGMKLGKYIFRSVHKGFGGNLRLMTSAGAPLDEKVASFYHTLGFDLLITYGLTETNIPIIGNRGDNITTDSCGLPYPKMEVKLAHPDESGEGEIYVKSPYMMKGYFRDEEATEAAFEDGWFKTGDLARLDEVGNVKITGRSKENIVLATGKKVTPTDIETHYTGVIGVDELVVSGVPNGEYDEVHAFVVKDALQLDDEKILESLQERASKLSAYMHLAKVHFIEEIPKTSLQKPKRYLLKKQALEANDGVDPLKVIVNEKIDKISDEDQNDHSLLHQLELALRTAIIAMTGLDEKLVTSKARIMSEIGIDSLTAIELTMKIEEKYQKNIASLMSQDPTVLEIAQFIANEKEPDLAVEEDDEEQEEDEIEVNEKGSLHYVIFKMTALLAHLLYKVKTTNQEVLPEDKGYIICANHVSNIDYLWVAQSFSKSRFLNFCCLAKQELFKKAWLNHLLKDVCGMIPVNRGGLNYEIMQLCEEKLKENWGLLIHPEGTRSSDGKLGTFKKGAATIAIKAGVPIIPVYIKGAHEIFPRDRKMPKFFNPGTKRRYEVEVIYGEPIEASNFSAEELTEKVESAIKDLMVHTSENELMSTLEQVTDLNVDTHADLNIKEDVEETVETEEQNIVPESEVVIPKVSSEIDRVPEKRVKEETIKFEKKSVDETYEIEPQEVQPAMDDSTQGVTYIPLTLDKKQEVDQVIDQQLNEQFKENHDTAYQEEITSDELLECDLEVNLINEIETKDK